MKKFQMKKMTVAITLGLGTVFSTQAIAQNAKSVGEATAQVANGQKLVEVGFAKENLQPLKGFATSLPFVEVLKQLTPNGWIVKKKDSAEHPISIKTNVSWNGGKTWVETLNGVLFQTNASAIVDWNEKEIILVPSKHQSKITVTETKSQERNSPQVSVFELGQGSSVPAATAQVAVVKEEVKVEAPAAKEAIQVVEVKEDVKVVSPSTTSEVEVTETIAQGSTKYKTSQDITVQEITTVDVVEIKPVVQTWILSNTKTLKENVKGWAAQAGYEVEWMADDYPQDITRTLTGAFDAENGPIAQLANDYGPNSRLQKPLAFVFYQNGYLVVEELKYEQQGFPQYGQ